jgi:hypothetical protein
MMKNKAILLDNDTGRRTEFARLSIGSNSDFNEKWLQNIIFEDISLLNVVDPSFDKIDLVPLCRELPLHDTIRNVFLDILAVTETGQLVLVECKLWKNPQARREVIAQIFEYASLLKSLSYSDLVAKLRNIVGSGKEDPILYQFRQQGVEFDEARLIDNISHSLKTAKFQLVIAGDGIRADLINLAKSANFSGVVGDLSLLEIGLYRSGEGSVIVVPSIPAKTETIVKTVILSPDGAPVSFDEEGGSPISYGARSRGNADVRAANRKFWDRFIETVKKKGFAHPDQTLPRHGGDNWVKIDFPDPFGRITACRIASDNRLSVFASVSDANAERAHDFFSGHVAQLKKELGDDISLEFITDRKSWGNGFFVSVTKHEIEDIYDPATEETQVSWLFNVLDKFVTGLRPLCRDFSEGSD